MLIYTRQQYTDDYSAIFTTNPDVKSPFMELRPLTRALHRRYYSQFVSEATISAVVSAIGAKRLLAAKDIENLNDIPLAMWDKITPAKAYSFEKAGDFATLSNNVCVSKEAALQWIERQKEIETN